MFEVMSMPKIRVSELAKEINIDVKELLEYLAGLDANTKNHMSFVDEALAVQARRRFSKTGALDIQVKPVQPRPVGMPPRARGPIRRGRPIGAASKPGDLGQAPAPGEKAEGKPGGAAVPQAPAITPAASAAATAQAAKTPSAENAAAAASAATATPAATTTPPAAAKTAAPAAPTAQVAPAKPAPVDKPAASAKPVAAAKAAAPAKAEIPVKQAAPPAPPATAASAAPQATEERSARRQGEMKKAEAPAAASPAAQAAGAPEPVEGKDSVPAAKPVAETKEAVVAPAAPKPAAPRKPAAPTPVGKTPAAPKETAPPAAPAKAPAPPAAQTRTSVPEAGPATKKEEREAKAPAAGFRTPDTRREPAKEAKAPFSPAASAAPAEGRKAEQAPERRTFQHQAGERVPSASAAPRPTPAGGAPRPGAGAPPRDQGRRPPRAAAPAEPVKRGRKAEGPPPGEAAFPVPIIPLIKPEAGAAPPPKKIEKDIDPETTKRKDRKSGRAGTGRAMREKVAYSRRDHHAVIQMDAPVGPRSLRRRPRKPVKQQQTAEVQEEVRPSILYLPDSLTVAELAAELRVPATAVIKTLMSEGVMAAINNVIDFDVAKKVAAQFEVTVERSTPTEKERVQRIGVEAADKTDNLATRPPVVTILGHVDHGKTTLLDAIRQTRVVETEAGGITQHIGAYQVEKDGRKITFLDTPGHEAFTEMRSRGAQVTDIAVLVVAADDGVMPQTVEAINHARAAGVPIVVAINKIDRPGANPDRVKQQLADNDLLAEDWGGDTVMVEVSALKKEGIEDLLEMILLVADIRELKADYNCPASGTVIEAELDKTRGPVATVLVQNGVLRVGDAVVVGVTSGKIRAMFDYRGAALKEAGPSTPVSVLGIEDVPAAGDSVQVVEDEKAARQAAEEKLAGHKTELQKAGRLRLSDLFSKIQEGEVKDLNIVLKADVQGSVEALTSSLEKLSDNKVRVNVIHGAAGAITESDIALAAASDGIIIGFNVRPDPAVRRAAEREGVDIHLYRIIYEAIDDVKKAMAGLLEPTYKEDVLGRAEVRATFKVPGVGTVAGCYVSDGKVVRNASVRVLRDSVVIFEGKLSSLKRFKDDAREVAEGYECGIGIERFNDIKEGDVIEAYQMQEVKV